MNMKNLWLYIFSISILLLTACDDFPLPQMPSWGYLTADMNGKDWSKTYKNAYQTIQAWDSNDNVSDTFVIMADLYNPYGARRQELYFQNIPSEKGHYTMLKDIPYENKYDRFVYGSLYTLVSDGDASGDTYSVLDTEKAFFQIDEAITKTREIKGTFQVTFVINKPRYDTALPDTLRFRNGKFHTKIMEHKRRNRKLL
ncbi:hypothetical protein FEM33_05780 [Dyadobacter flavalbus]|uniref:Uncharacterized protein n=1 Tax=Dyadobacter flavalbus TaxID=2579942 RepID=A0A5M8QZL8_9BACT|nr:hypothetical protein [Dyadobacter flavalbus]KAA6440116.1 hypothetical protein FEM33_05780 [Dyadobacter flavalbus]